MYRTGRLINGKLFLKTLSGDWISLQMLIDNQFYRGVEYA